MTNYTLLGKTQELHTFLKEWYQLQKWEIKEFNLTGIRWPYAEDIKSKDKYKDLLIAWTDKEIIPVIGTTDPGVYYTKNRMNPRGCAHVKEGFYPNVYRLWFHNYTRQTKHEAWVQEGKLNIWQDANGDFKFDESVDLLNSGVFGINYHADVYGKLNDGLIGYASAGCQVVENLNDLKRQISLFKTTEMYKKGNRLVSYGLINCNNLTLPS